MFSAPVYSKADWVELKENSELKPTLLRLKNDYVTFCSWLIGLGKYILSYLLIQVLSDTRSQLIEHPALTILTSIGQRFLNWIPQKPEVPRYKVSFYKT